MFEGIARELGRRQPRPAESGTFDAEAAVAFILRPAGTGLEFLAIKRTESERDPWSGHMALPGGRCEEGDSDLWATARRETKEEVCLDLAKEGRLLGQLDVVVPATLRIPSIAITPFVAAVGEGAVARACSEVEDALWLPLDVLVNEEYRGRLKLEEVPDREYPTIEYSGRVIWGLTLKILHQVEELLQTLGYQGGDA